MPLNEKETHPFLEKGQSIPGQRMIVGTFPVYSITAPQSDFKKNLARSRGDMQFFYGSRSNRMWQWYRQYVDPAIDPQEVSIIVDSLIRNRIKISDVVSQCFRVEYSFQDSDLRDKTWNYELGNLVDSGVNKILCTSKSAQGAMGWLKQYILITQGYTEVVNKSRELHHKILQAIPNHNSKIISIASILTKGTRTVEIVALPSPGSPERRINDFGRVQHSITAGEYLDLYLKSAFNWFLQPD